MKAAGVNSVTAIIPYLSAWGAPVGVRSDAVEVHRVGITLSQPLGGERWRAVECDGVGGGVEVRPGCTGDNAETTAVTDLSTTAAVTPHKVFFLGISSHFALQPVLFFLKRSAPCGRRT